jgi:hemin uptake protein HemP
MPENGPTSLPPAGDNAAPPSGAPRGDERRTWTTEELLGEQREVLIRHGADVYRLRITRHGKLILYK